MFLLRAIPSYLQLVLALKTFTVGGEKLGLTLNSAQLGLQAWAELGKILRLFEDNIEMRRKLYENSLKVVLWHTK